MKYEQIEKDGMIYDLVPSEEMMVGREFVKEYLGISSATVSRNPWNLPDFGVALKGTRNKKPYRKNDVVKWLSIPDRQRKKKYEEWRKSNETNQ